MKRFINIFLLLLMVALIGQKGKAATAAVPKVSKDLSHQKLTQELGIQLITDEGVAQCKVLPLQPGEEKSLFGLFDIAEEEEENSEKKHPYRKYVSAKKFYFSGAYYLIQLKTPTLGIFYAPVAPPISQNDHAATPIAPKRYILLQDLRN